MHVANWFRGVVLAAGVATLGQANAGLLTVDQESVGPTNFSGSGGVTNGQSFTPSFSSIDGAEFRIRSDGASSTLHLEVREGQGLLGTLLGSSGQVTIDSILSVVHFDLLSSVTLSPGSLYTLILALDSGTTFAGDISNLNPYAGGLAIDNAGSSFAGLDFWFREGTHAAQVPEPSMLALLALGFAGLSWNRRRKHLAAA